MDESDSDREDGHVPDRDTDVPYPLEGKYKDSRDKSKISAMPQLERERILGERAEEMSRAQFQAELARRARDMGKANMQSDRKRKAASQDPDDSDHRTSRPKVKVKMNDKLEEYKRNREQRGQQRERQNDRHNDRRRRSSSGDRRGDSDVDADGESEVDWDDRRKEAPRVEQPATLSDFEAVRMGRSFFSQVCFYPGFEDAMTGTFARIGTGIDAQRRTLYKMAQIKGACFP
jgi:RNA polymerase-associated protein RTF1